MLPGRRLHVETSGVEKIDCNDTRAVFIGNAVRLYSIHDKKVRIVAPDGMVIDREERLTIADVEERLGRIRVEELSTI